MDFFYYQELILLLKKAITCQSYYNPAGDSSYAKRTVPAEICLNNPAGLLFTQMNMFQQCFPSVLEVLLNVLFRTRTLVRSSVSEPWV